MASQITQLRWGIVSAGAICNDFVNSIRYVAARNKVPGKFLSAPAPAGDAGKIDIQVGCVGARSEESAMKFAKRHGIPRAYGSYEQVFADPDIDIVYVGTINTGHKELTLKALRAGKHVVCEKPLGLNLKEVEEMQAVAKAENRFLLEGMWTRFFPLITTKLNSLLHEEKLIGEVKSVSADFCIVVGRDAQRMYDLKMGGGSLLDLGIYPLAFVPLVFSSDLKPTSISCEGAVCPGAGVDLEGFLSLSLPDQKSASVHWSMQSSSPEEVIISGEKGFIRIHGSAHTPVKMTVNLIDGRGFKEMEITAAGGPPEAEMREAILGGTSSESDSLEFTQNYPGSQGFVYEVDAVHDAILAGKKESADWSWQDTRYTCGIMDEWRRKMGVKYATDPWIGTESETEAR